MKTLLQKILQRNKDLFFKQFLFKTTININGQEHPKNKGEKGFQSKKKKLKNKSVYNS